MCSVQQKSKFGMDKVTNFQECLKKALQEYAESIPKNKGYTYQTIFDTEGQHYLILEIGWENGVRIHRVLLHFDIIDEKIWVQENRTEEEFEEYFEEFAIQEEDIFIGYLQPKEVVLG